MRWAETTQPAVRDIRGQGNNCQQKKRHGKEKKKKKKTGKDKKGKKKKERSTRHMVPEWSEYSYTDRATDVPDKITEGIQ